MKIAITGGTGFIGQRFIQRVGREYDEIIVLTRSPEKYTADHPVRYVGWNPDNLTGWERELEGLDCLINLAGENLAGEGFFPERWTEEKRRKIIDSRKNTGHILARAVKSLSKPPKVFLQASAIGYYGTDREKTFVESDPPGDDFLASVCEIWENSSKEVEEVGVSHCVVRIGVILSPESGALLRMLLPYRLFVGGPFGSGEQYYSWIHIDDVVGAMGFLTRETSVSPAYNLTAPNPVRNKVFGRVLGRVMKRPSWLPIPGFAMRLAFGDVSTVVLEGQKVIPQNLQRDGYEFMFEELEPAFEDLLTDAPVRP